MAPKSGRLTTIDSAILIKLYKSYVFEELPDDHKTILRKFGLAADSDHHDSNIHLLNKCEDKRRKLKIVDGKLKEDELIEKDAPIPDPPMGPPFKKLDEPGKATGETSKPEGGGGDDDDDEDDDEEGLTEDEKKKRREEREAAENENRDVGGASNEPMKSEVELENAIKSLSFKLNEDHILSHLQEYIRKADLAEESYTPQEVKIKYFMQINHEPNKLIAAGTKVLDAIIFCSLKDNEAAQAIFEVTEVQGLTSAVASRNTVAAQRAIQAAAVLVYGQGSLPLSSGNSGKSVMNFIKEHIYKGNLTNYDTIGAALSRCSTRKFPARVFLNLDLKLLPTPVMTRCKLSIAGNKALRYAVFVAPFEKCKMPPPAKEDDGETVAVILKSNERKKHALDIADYLRTLATEFTMQLVMHPLSVNRVSTKNFNLKLTRAVLESLSNKGRLDMAKAIDERRYAAFKADENFYGTLSGTTRTWPILSNPDMDFSEITVGTLKLAYSKKE